MVKFFNCKGVAKDSNGIDHVVTVVGKLETTKVTDQIGEHEVIDGERVMVVRDVKFKLKTLTFGYSICNPNDVFDEEEGIRVAKRRIKNNVCGCLNTTDHTMLTDDACEFYIVHKLMYIQANIDRYLPKA